jgi:hypothetical protein
MWAAALYVFVGAIVAFGAWRFACAGPQNKRLSLTPWAVAAGVLWPVLLLGVAEGALIFAVVASMRWLARLVDHVPAIENAWLDEEESVPA